jgi:hypothetical protein
METPPWRPLANQNEEDTALVLSTNKEANKIILHHLYILAIIIIT